MTDIPKEIKRFIKEHHVMTLATHNGSEPYCANLFYAFSSDLNGFVYTSSSETRHGGESLQNSRVAGSIVVETKVVGKVRGLQISGTTQRAVEESEKSAKLAYLRKFPFAVVAPLELWIFKPDYMKLTDNRLGFGKKIEWNGDR